MNFNDNINKTFKQHLDKAILLTIIKEKHNGIDFLYVKALNSLEKSLKKPGKAALKSLVEAKFEYEMTTPAAQDIFNFYKNEKARENLVNEGNLQKTKDYLLNVTIKRELYSLVDGFIKSGNIPVLKMMIEHPLNELQKIEPDHGYCLFAIEANQKELFDYFRLTIDEVVESPNEFIMTFATRAVDNDCKELLEHIMLLGSTDLNQLLMGSVLGGEYSMPSFLVDKGASMEYVKSLSPYYEEHIHNLSAYRLQASLQENLRDKPHLKSLKL